MSEGQLRGTMTGGRQGQQNGQGGARNNNRRILLVCDTETVPDPQFVTEEGEPALNKPGLHKVVALSSLVASIETDEAGFERYTVLKAGCRGKPESGEADILKAHWDTVASHTPRIVTWNGGRFDVLNWQLRAMRHAVPGSVWSHAGDRYNNYTYRYCETYHADLMDMLTGYGAVPGLSQDDAAKLFGMPGKGAVSGSAVRELYDAGKINDIRAYAEEDVFDLFGLYVRYAYFNGRTNAAGHDASMLSLRQHLENRIERGETAHQDYLRRWQQAQAPYPVTIVAAVEETPAPAAETANTSQATNGSGAASPNTDAQAASTGQDAVPGNAAGTADADPGASAQTSAGTTAPDSAPDGGDAAPAEATADGGDGATSPGGDDASADRSAEASADGQTDASEPAATSDTADDTATETASAPASEEPKADPFAVDPDATAPAAGTSPPAGSAQEEAPAGRDTAGADNAAAGSAQSDQNANAASPDNAQGTGNEKAAASAHRAPAPPPPEDDMFAFS